ncbi:MAG: glutamate synthase subunit beta [Spirochaetia bacterium]|nr:glutamate synthase subunit beta [Spirochaetia bacterium]
MGKPTGFQEFERTDLKKDPIKQRVKHYREFEHTYDKDTTEVQCSRCMNCGIPFCHAETGCPLNNLIPEWNDLIYRDHWRLSLENLHSTNNFPEFTGRVCPAPCESACTLGLIEKPVSIKSIERSIIEHGFENGWVKPRPPKEINNITIAVIGSGPAGLACAQQLARAGYVVTVFEKNRFFGGLLRYGIPDFKLDKNLIERRISQMRFEGINFKGDTHIGKDIKTEDLLKKYDAIVIATGSEKPRDLPVKNRNLKGIHFAMEYLTEQNRILSGEIPNHTINAKDKHVVVIGGGDTGSDCVGTANRQGAKSVTQLEILPEPPVERPDDTPWPFWPRILRTSSSHEEGVTRMWSVSTKEFTGTEKVESLIINQVEMKDGKFADKADTKKEIKADLVFIAMGFEHTIHEGLIEELKKEGLKLDKRGNIKADTEVSDLEHCTSVAGVFACGDARRGQSLVVSAIAEGRQCAYSVHQYFIEKQKKEQQGI